MLTHTDFEGQTTEEQYDDSTQGSDGRLKEEDRFTAGVDSTPDEKTVYGYDTFGRENQVDEYIGSSKTRTTITTYDPVTGDVGSVASPEGTINYTYDDSDRLSRTFTADGTDIRYGL